MAFGSGLGLKVPTELMLTKPMLRYFIAYKAIKRYARGLGEIFKQSADEIKNSISTHSTLSCVITSVCCATDASQVCWLKVSTKLVFVVKNSFLSFQCKLLLGHMCYHLITDKEGFISSD
jgi:hypothetical protein